MSIKRNIASNLFASIWVTALSLAVTPVQINLLGIEAYGLIGFVATLQIFFAVFDLGLSSTLTREIAGDRSLAHVGSVELIRTASTIYWLFAFAVAAALACASSFIARHWFHSGHLSQEAIEQALYAMTLYLAARWPTALYMGVMSGFQRMDVLNAIKVAIATLRLLGGIAVLLVWRQLQMFLWWTALTALVEVMAYFIACRRIFPGMPLRFGRSMASLRSVWGFSLSMSVISLLALCISQLDRLIVSKLLPLDDLGHYTLAYNVAAVASLVISAVSSAMVPSFAAARSLSPALALSRRYEQANRVVLFVVGLVVFPLAFFGKQILTVWIGPAAALGAGRPLALLAIGFWLSAALSNAYSMSIATGHQSLPLRLSAGTALPYAAVLFWLTREHGVDGAALAWLLLNLAYVMVLIPAVHVRLKLVPATQWLLKVALPFLALGLLTFAPAKLLSLQPALGPGTTSGVLPLLVSIVMYLCFGYRLLGPHVQAEIATILRLGGRRSAR